MGIDVIPIFQVRNRFRSLVEEVAGPVLNPVLIPSSDHSPSVHLLAILV